MKRKVMLGSLIALAVSLSILLPRQYTQIVTCASYTINLAKQLTEYHQNQVKQNEFVSVKEKRYIMMVSSYPPINTEKENKAVIKEKKNKLKTKNKIINKVAPKKEEVKKQSYTEEELNLLSHLIFGETGADYCSDENQIAVASVVLNRVKNKNFPNTIREVIFQKGQYACTWDGNFDKTPNERAIKNARFVLENGSQIPENVIWQSQFKQGKGVWKLIQTHYFCY